jgi:hypothetical protein
MDINLFRWLIVFVGIILISGSVVFHYATVNAEQEQQIADLDEMVDDYVSNYDQMSYPDLRIRTIYTNYNLYFGGMILEQGQLILLIRNDIPQAGIDYLNNNNLPHRFVKYNYHELLSARKQIEKVLYQYHGVVAIWTDEINNRINVEKITGTILPSDIDCFLESGILFVGEVENYPVLT